MSKGFPEKMTSPRSSNQWSKYLLHRSVADEVKSEEGFIELLSFIRFKNNYGIME